MIPFIDTVVEPGLGLLAEGSLRWLLLIALVAAWLGVAPPRRAVSRYLLCLVVLVSGLLLPLVPRWGKGLYPVGRSMPAAAETAQQAPPPANLPFQTSREHRADGPPAPGYQAAPAGPGTRIVAPPASESLGVRRWVLLGLAGVWAGGVLLALLRCLGGWLFLERLRRQAIPVPATALGLFESCRAEMGLRRRAVLAVHPQVGSPLTLGLFCPAILVPPTWANLPEHAQRGALLHELAHLVRYDDWLAAALELVRAAFFFHPAVRWLLRRLECERELLCDEAAVARGVAANAYVRMLLHFAGQPGRLLPWALGAAAYPPRIGTRRTVKLRIHHLLEENMHPTRPPAPRGRLVLLGVVVLGMALGLGSLRIWALEPSPSAEEKPPAAPADAAKPPKADDPAKAEYRIEPFHVLNIRVIGTLPDQPIAGDYLVEPEGKVDFGPVYGRVKVSGLTIDQATEAIQRHLMQFIREQPGLSVIFVGWVAKWQHDPDRQAPYRIKPNQGLRIRATETLPDNPISGPHLVELSGKVDLGPRYGKVAVGGLTTEQAAEAIQKHLAQRIKDPRVSVTLSGWEKDWQRLDEEGGRPGGTPQGAKVSKDALRFGGKSFAAWRADMTTELKADVRIDAMKALGVFGTNGYAREATAVILEIMRGYDASLDDHDDQRVVRAACKALARIGEPAVTPLRDELKRGTLNGRRFAVTALKELGPAGHTATPDLIAALPAEDVYVHRQALFALAGLGVEGTPDYIAAFAEVLRGKDAAARRQAAGILSKVNPPSPAVIDALARALQDPDWEIRAHTAQLLGTKRSAAAGAVPALLERLKDDKPLVRVNAAVALGNIKAHARTVVPALAQALRDDNTDVCRNAADALAQFGPEAKEAVPALVRELKEGFHGEHWRIVHVLGKIGPAAAEALPALTECLKREGDINMRRALVQAMQKITK
jgi:HEAT repeat protein/beta-lactamase regulating signal transducer with metallopeptidase domain/protein involved in polysaccharide export with SLBB domain